MTTERFFQSIEDDNEPSEEFSNPLKALWLVQKDRWEEAHDLCNEIPGETGSWIHAYLHRVEGDLGNAGYWYARANKTAPASSVSLQSEWQSLVAALIRS